MKRNPDLIRELLLELEQLDDPGPPDLVLERDNAEEETRARHVMLAEEGGLITWTAEDHTRGSYHFTRIRLTGLGHDFLETIRSESTWTSVKARAAVAGNFGIQVLIGIASALAVESIKSVAGQPGS